MASAAAYANKAASDVVNALAALLQLEDTASAAPTPESKAEWDSSVVSVRKKWQTYAGLVAKVPADGITVAVPDKAIFDLKVDTADARLQILFQKTLSADQLAQSQRLLESKKDELVRRTSGTGLAAVSRDSGSTSMLLAEKLQEPDRVSRDKPKEKRESGKDKGEKEKEELSASRASKKESVKASSTSPQRTGTDVKSRSRKSKDHKETSPAPPTHGSTQLHSSSPRHAQPHTGNTLPSSRSSSSASSSHAQSSAPSLPPFPVSLPLSPKDKDGKESKESGKYQHGTASDKATNSSPRETSAVSRHSEKKATSSGHHTHRESRKEHSKDQPTPPPTMHPLVSPRSDTHSSRTTTAGQQKDSDEPDEDAEYRALMEKMKANLQQKAALEQQKKELQKKP